MKGLRVLFIALVVTLGAAVPIVSALSPTPHSSVMRVAEGPTPTPMPIVNPNSPCHSGGC